jgi:hypothetical protein
MVDKPLVDLPQCKCLRCFAIWIPRTPNPAVCPKCHSVHWNTPEEEMTNMGRPRFKNGDNEDGK